MRHRNILPQCAVIIIHLEDVHMAIDVNFFMNPNILTRRNQILTLHRIINANILPRENRFLILHRIINANIILGKNQFQILHRIINANIILRKNIIPILHLIINAKDQIPNQCIIIHMTIKKTTSNKIII